jgi:cytochrome c-type biogenesis protein CcmH
MRCLVCQGQSIADSDAEMAGDMRDLVRRRIGEGESPRKSAPGWSSATALGHLSPARPAGDLALWLAPLVLLAGAY